MAGTWLVCLWWDFFQEVGSFLVIFRTDFFGHMLSLSICGVHSMEFGGKGGETF